ncbi:MAG: HAD-IC family P-type ATPase, partial [Pseudobdellovibrio sp.]
MKQGESPLKVKKATSLAWQKFNLKEIEEQFNYSKCPLYKNFRFYLEGLQCSSCVHLLEEFPRYFEDIISAKLNYGDRTLIVQAKPNVELGVICQAIESMGYTPSPLNECSDYDKARNIEKQNELKRIGVAGAVAGNAMLFAVALYAGLSDELGLIFKWIMFFTFLPLMFYSAVPFYKKAWSSLLARRINVDMMITVALWAGFIFSTYSLVVGSDDLYFDSSASFIFLILLTRYFLRQHQDKLLRKNIYEDLFNQEAYEVLGVKPSYINFKNIEPGQVIVLKKNQLVPCDGLLQSEASSFDLAFLTGESYPQTKHHGDEVLAGSRLLSESAKVDCVTSSVKSNLAQALNSIDLNQSENKIQSLSDIVAHRLTLVVFSVAIVFFVLTYQALGFEAFKRCLALITIACPCAVAFGTPLAFSLGLRKASSRGFFIRSEIVFQKLAEIKKVIFDKTGTLTSAQFTLIKSFPEQISSENKSVILGLEKASLHPLALGLKEAWSDFETADIKNVTEKIGEGVEANYNGHIYRIGKSTNDLASQTTQIDFSIDGKKIAYLFFAEKIRAEAKNVIKNFHKLNYEVMMLTGDKRNRAIEASKVLGIRPSCVFAENSAESKKHMI